MDYRQKFYKARELQSEADLQKDRELLAKHKPNHPLLFRSSNLSSGGKISFDIVFELLDIVSADQILENRQIREVAVIPSLISTAQEVKKRVPKDEEFPRIKWKDLTDSEVQKAELIYSDRINTFRRLIELEKELDKNPTEVMLAEFVELSIRNRLCREELTSFNNKGYFLGQHPIIAENKFHKEMSELLKNNPDEFMRKLKNVQLNIGRYSSYIRDPRKSAAVDTNTEKLNHWQFKLNIMSSILKDSLHG